MGWGFFFCKRGKGCRAFPICEADLQRWKSCRHWVWLTLCNRKGKPVNQQEMLRAAAETLCFFHQATRASLRIKLTAKFSYISLELVSGVIRSEHLWREWRLSRGSLSAGMLLPYPVLQGVWSRECSAQPAQHGTLETSQDSSKHLKYLLSSACSCLLFHPGPEQNLFITLKWISQERLNHMKRKKHKPVLFSGAFF